RASGISLPSSRRSATRQPALGVLVVYFPQDLLEPARRLPAREVALERPQIADPPAMVADSVLLGERPAQPLAGDPLAELDRLEHRAVHGAAAADVVDRPPGACVEVEVLEGRDEIRRVD